jgi:hypothetical protein
MTKVPSKLSGIQINQSQQNTGGAAIAAVALPNSIQMQGGKRNIIGTTQQV